METCMETCMLANIVFFENLKAEENEGFSPEQPPRDHDQGLITNSLICISGLYSSHPSRLAGPLPHMPHK